MKILFIADRKIDKLPNLKAMFSNWMKQNAEIEPTFFNETRDLSDYPTRVDSSGTVRPTDAWLRSIGKDVHNRYSGEGTDHIVILIHEDNWKSGRIWGTNWSNVYSGYQVHYCRWDRDNIANSFGTLWHEFHHSIDALCKTYEGVDVASLLDVHDWDADITHGGSSSFDYIRYKENAASLIATAPYLRRAYAKRDAIYQQKVGTMKKQIALLEQIIILLRQFFIKSNTQKS